MEKRKKMKRGGIKTLKGKTEFKIEKRKNNKNKRQHTKTPCIKREVRKGTNKLQ